MSTRFTTVVVFTTAILFTSLIGVCNGQLLRSNGAMKTSLLSDIELQNFESDRHSLVITNANEIRLADDSENAEVKISVLPAEDKEVDSQGGSTSVYVDNKSRSKVSLTVACSTDNGDTYDIYRKTLSAGRGTFICKTNYPTVYYHGISSDGKCEWGANDWCRVDEFPKNTCASQNIKTSKSSVKFSIRGCPS